jgi:hypothetical protein
MFAFLHAPFSALNLILIDLVMMIAMVRYICSHCYPLPVDMIVMHVAVLTRWLGELKRIAFYDVILVFSRLSLDLAG